MCRSLRRRTVFSDDSATDSTSEEYRNDAQQRAYIAEVGAPPSLDMSAVWPAGAQGEHGCERDFGVDALAALGAKGKRRAQAWMRNRRLLQNNICVQRSRLASGGFWRTAPPTRTAGSGSGAPRYQWPDIVRLGASARESSCGLSGVLDEAYILRNCRRICLITRGALLDAARLCGRMPSVRRGPEDHRRLVFVLQGLEFDSHGLQGVDYRDKNGDGDTLPLYGLAGLLADVIRPVQNPVACAAVVAGCHA